MQSHRYGPLSIFCLFLWSCRACGGSNVHQAGSMTPVSQNAKCFWSKPEVWWTGRFEVWDRVQVFGQAPPAVSSGTTCFPVESGGVRMWKQVWECWENKLRVPERKSLPLMSYFTFTLFCWESPKSWTSSLGFVDLILHAELWSTSGVNRDGLVLLLRDRVAQISLIASEKGLSWILCLLRVFASYSYHISVFVRDVWDFFFLFLCWMSNLRPTWSSLPYLLPSSAFLVCFFLSFSLWSSRCYSISARMQWKCLSQSGKRDKKAFYKQINEAY